MTTLEQVRGDQAEWDVNAQNGDGTPVEDGTTVRLTVRSTYDTDVDPVINVTATTTDGSATLVVPAAVTEVLANRTHRLAFDVQLEGADAGPWTIDRGQYVILPEAALVATGGRAFDDGFDGGFS